MNTSFLFFVNVSVCVCVCLCVMDLVSNRMKSFDCFDNNFGTNFGSSVGVLLGYRFVWGFEGGVFEYTSVSSPPKIVYWMPLATYIRDHVG